MKRLMYKMKNISRQTGGETIVESIISLFIFTVLMISVTTILNSALGMTGLATENNKVSQDKINKLVKGEGYDDEGAISFSIDGDEVGGHQIEFYNDSDSFLIAFRPKE